MRPFFQLILAFLTAFSGVAQAQEFDAIAKKADALYPDKPFVVWKATDAYTFAKSPDRDSPITAKQTADRQIVKLRGDENVYYSVGSNSYSSIRFVSGATYNSSRKKFTNSDIYTKAIAYESGGIFHNDYFENPIMIYGSIDSNFYQINYAKIIDDYKFLPIAPLFGEYPTMEYEVTIEVPSWMKIRLVERNFESFGIESTVETTPSGTLHKYIWKDMPKIESEPYSASARHYLPHVLLVFESYDRNGKTEKLMPNTADLYGWYRELVLQVENNPLEIADLVDKFKDIPKGMEQIDAVNKWISENIRYIAFEAGIAGFKPDECQKVYNNKYGDCKGMANLCKHVLVGLGYDARLAWIGTRSQVPYDYEIPSLAADNHMITAVKLDGEFIFLDPTETWGGSHEYAFRIQGRPVLIEDGESFIVQNVPESNLQSDRIQRSCTVLFDPSTKASTYTVETTYYGEPKKRLLSGYNYTISKNREEALTESLRINKQGSFNLLEYEGLDHLGDSIRIKYTFTTVEGIIDLGDEIYVDMDPSGDLEKVRMVDARKSNWYFNERYTRNTDISFKIPPGYKVDHHPKDIDVKSDDFELQITHNLSGEYMNITKRIKVPKGEISKQNTEAWETAVKELNAYYEDRLILTKE